MASVYPVGRLLDFRNRRASARYQGLTTAAICVFVLRPGFRAVGYLLGLASKKAKTVGAIADRASLSLNPLSHRHAIDFDVERPGEAWHMQENTRRRVAAVSNPRAIRLTAVGRRGLRQVFGMEPPDLR